MNLVSLTAVGVRLLAILIFFYVLRESSRLVSLSVTLESNKGWFISALFLVIFILVGLWLWVSALKIAEWIVPNNITVTNASSNDLDSPICKLSFILFGLYILISGISEFSYYAQIYFFTPNEIKVPIQEIKLQAAMVSSVIEMLFGLILVFGSRGLSKVIYKIRYGNQ